MATDAALSTTSGRRTLTLFAVRHAQSRWNAAQKEWALGKLLAECDHPLSGLGCRQALLLKDDLGACISSEGSAGLGALRNATAVWSSPATRSLQTALVGLRPLLEQASLPVYLAPDAREVQKLGSLDNIGVARGERCAPRALRHLGGLVAEHELAALRELRVDAADATRRWWHPLGIESKRRLHARLHRLLQQLGESPHATVVLVSHSNALRELMRIYLHPDAPEPARRMRAEKLPNCAIAKCTLECGGGAPCVITAAELLYVPEPSSGAHQPSRWSWRRRKRVAPDASEPQTAAPEKVAG